MIKAVNSFIVKVIVKISVEYLYLARLLVGVSTAIITTTVYTVEVHTL